MPADSARIRSTGDPQDLVDKLWLKILVGSLQRPENQCWCGFPAGPFGYNESPTSSCHTFCWKARRLFDVPFFCLPPRGFTALHFAGRSWRAAQRPRPL
jgi:hypothetical protein